MNEILELIDAGNRREALQLLNESQYTFMDLLETVEDEFQSSELLKIIRVAIDQSYISFNPANLRN